MNVELTIAVYQHRQDEQLSWTTVGLGPHDEHVTGRSAVKLQRKLIDKLRKKLSELDREELTWFQVHRGTHLVRVRAEMLFRAGSTGGRRRMSGRFPLVVVPRFINDDERRLVVYHPRHGKKWFSPSHEDAIAEEAGVFFRNTWSELSEDVIRDLETDGKDRLVLVSFNASVPSLMDSLEADEDKRRRAEQRKSGPVLAKLGSDQTLRVVEGSLPLGTARLPYRRQLGQLLGAQRRRSVVVVGPTQVGKSMVIHRAIADLLDAEDFPTHRNLDKVHHVWALSGKRIIAGMSYLGDWEQRCLDLMVESKKKRAVLWFEDLHLFGRLGRTRQSDRNLASFFLGPVQSGALTVIGECTPEQWQRLEDDAPSFAALFTKVRVHPTDAGETMAMLITEARELEQTHRCSFHPFTYRTVLELSGSLFPWAAFPGKAMDLLQQLARQPREPDEVVVAGDVVALASSKTGLPESMLTLREALDEKALRRGFASRVMGQPDAVDAACRLVFRIRAGMVDPARPYAVMLFTGPTGTGKTEMARGIAEYLYGGRQRLLRLDMSEYATPDAVARLIGDRWEPEGILTQRIREQPFSVLLLDEIEKAHPSVLYLLLQLFDEGRLTDAAGNMASFHQCVVIMTSNLGAKPNRPIGFGDKAEGILSDIDKAVREFFPPELFNRMDEVVPFGPLTEEVAESIATKELAGLLSRRGLRERNIFVYANAAVKRRIVEEAFDPQHGARTVKRYLEDRIASLLADEVARQTRASMQVVRIYEQQGSYCLHGDPLTETEPASVMLPFEPWLELPVLLLRERALPHALAELESIDVDAAVEAARDAVGAGRAPNTLYYWLDWYRARVEELREWMRAHAGLARPDAELVEARTFTHDRVVTHGREHRVRMFDRREATDNVPAAGKDELLGNLAEASFLARHVADLESDNAHEVFLELLAMGVTGAPRRAPVHRGLLERLVSAYANDGAWERLAWRDATGQVHRLRSGDDLAPLLDGGPSHVVLVLSAFFARDRIASEQGCHIWRSPSSEPEIVRVRVVAAPTEGDPSDVLQQHQRARAAFEAALDAGEKELPDNPERLDPAVRTYQFRPPVEDGAAPFLMEVEDFRLGYAATSHVRRLSDVVKRIGWLWMARSPQRARSAQPQGEDLA
jgi:ATP-dependent Clp protease ATP-binding subunit ClpC